MRLKQPEQHYCSVRLISEQSRWGLLGGLEVTWQSPESWHPVGLGIWWEGQPKMIRPLFSASCPPFLFLNPHPAETEAVGGWQWWILLEPFLCPPSHVHVYSIATLTWNMMNVISMSVAFKTDIFAIFVMLFLAPMVRSLDPWHKNPALWLGARRQSRTKLSRCNPYGPQDNELPFNGTHVRAKHPNALHASSAPGWGQIMSDCPERNELIHCKDWILTCLYADNTGHVTHAAIEIRKHYLLCTESGLWVLGGLILLFGWTMSTVWPFSPGNWLGARISTSLWIFSCDTTPVKGFCLFRTPSLPALISFSPTLTTRARPAMPGHSLLGEGSLDPAPIEGGRASLEDLDILQVGGER